MRTRRTMGKDLEVGDTIAFPIPIEYDDSVMVVMETITAIERGDGASVLDVYVETRYAYGDKPYNRHHRTLGAYDHYTTA